MKTLKMICQSVLFTSLIFMQACSETPEKKATETKSNMSAECTQYFDKLAELSEKDDKLKNTLDKNLMRAKDEWTKLSDEEKQKMSEVCKNMIVMLDSLEKIEN